MDTSLDLRQTPTSDIPSVVLDRFSALERGTGFVLLTDDEPTGVLDLLQEQRSGAFEWHPLLEGPPEWRVVVARRRANKPRRQVMEFMTADHHRIHELLRELLALAQKGDHGQLRSKLEHLETGLRKHFAMEEEILFPVIAAKLGAPRGPAALLRDEHLLAFEMLERIKHLCQLSERREEILQLTRGLRDLLANHSGIEERILYAVTDLLLGEEERDELVRRCQRV
jgi:uncharacterized protein (DUF2249 family)